MFVCIAVAFNFWFMGLPIIFLNLGLVVSLFIWTNFNRSYSRNVSCLYLIGTFKNYKPSFLVMWFFVVLGYLGNGILHMGLSLLRQEYFPGTVTAFFIFIIGVIVTREIARSFKIIQQPLMKTKFCR